jgi:hypothetical protein
LPPTLPQLSHLRRETTMTYEDLDPIYRPINDLIARKNDATAIIESLFKFYGDRKFPDIMDAMCDALNKDAADAQRIVIDTVPTTIKGLATKLKWLLGQDDDFYEDGVAEAILHTAQALHDDIKRRVDPASSQEDHEPQADAAE